MADGVAVASATAAIDVIAGVVDVVIDYSRSQVHRDLAASVFQLATAFGRYVFRLRYLLDFFGGVALMV